MLSIIGLIATFFFINNLSHVVFIVLWNTSGFAQQKLDLPYRSKEYKKHIITIANFSAYMRKLANSEMNMMGNWKWQIGLSNHPSYLLHQEEATQQELSTWRRKLPELTFFELKSLNFNEGMIYVCGLFIFWLIWLMERFIIQPSERNTRQDPEDWSFQHKKWFKWLSCHMHKIKWRCSITTIWTSYYEDVFRIGKVTY